MCGEETITIIICAFHIETALAEEQPRRGHKQSHPEASASHDDAAVASDSAIQPRGAIRLCYNQIKSLANFDACINEIMADPMHVGWIDLSFNKLRVLDEVGAGG